MQRFGGGVMDGLGEDGVKERVGATPPEIPPQGQPQGGWTPVDEGNTATRPAPSAPPAPVPQAPVPQPSGVVPVARAEPPVPLPAMLQSQPVPLSAMTATQPVMPPPQQGVPQAEIPPAQQVYPQPPLVQPPWAGPPPTSGWSTGAPQQPGVPQPGVGGPSRPGPLQLRELGRGPLATTLAIVVGAVLVAGLLVWSPWNPPSAPKNLAGRGGTPTTVVLTWADRSEGTGVERYVVERDGKEVGAAPGSQTSYTDKDLVPGSRHTYQVIAARGSKRSPASAAIAAGTEAPSPVELKQGKLAPHEVALQWSPPPDSPEPDQYIVLGNTKTLATVELASHGSQSYQLTGLDSGTAYSLQVQAVWLQGGTSAPSTPLPVTTPDPPIGDARLQGDGVPVSFKVTGTNWKEVPAGKTFTNKWSFTPSCSNGPCNVALTGNFGEEDTAKTFELTLNRSGATYSGSTKTSISNCRGKPVQNTVSVTITVNHASGPDWLADGWTGSISADSPYLDSGDGYYCPAGRTGATLTGKGSSTT